LDVVDLAKDPLAAGPLTRSTPRNSDPHKVLVVMRIAACLTISNL
jgi:hypothetical protein